MRRVHSIAAAAVVLSLAAGCATPRSPIMGPLYTSVSDGLLVNPGDIPENLKMGSSVATNIIGITTGDSSIDKARKSGGIKKIHYVDYYSWGILGVYSTTETRVYGE